MKKNIKKIVTAGSLMALGVLVFKFLPMRLWGSDILFDASLHLITASFVLYILWFFIDQNKNWRLPFFLFAALILFIISVQRIAVNAHNDIGLLLGLIISLLSIAIAERKNLRGKLRF